MLVGLASALALAAATSGAPVVTNPDWLHKPSGEDIASRYPKLMSFLGVEGHATIRCEVTIGGDADHCILLFETPVGVGFGPAALSLAPVLKFTPKKINGVAVRGGTVNVPISFTIDGHAADDPPPSPARAVDAPTRALAERLAALLDGPHYRPNAHTAIEAAAMAAPVDGDAKARARLVAAFQQAYLDNGPAALNLRAEAYAQLLTAQQLRDTLAFFESASGQAFMTNVAGTSPVLRQAIRAEHAAIAAEAMRIYCAEPGSCPGSATPARKSAKP